MNHIFKRVWSASRGTYVAVAENAKGHGKTCTTVTSALIASAILGGAAQAQALAAGALPTGGQVTAGQASIASQGAVMNVQQSSQRAAINWQSFNIGSGATVNFQQPNAQAITLNRVVGTERSVIDGALNANGNVYILNANGVLFNRHAQVNVGGLVASTLNISDADFMAGKSTFEATGQRGSVINLGTLTAANAGHIALLGQHVANEGVINATLGTAALAAGDKVRLNFNGNSLVGVTVERGTLNALVENKQAIVADGGLVTLTAKGLDQVMQTVVNNTGELRAQTIQNQEGRIFLLGGMAKDRIEVGGRLDASAPNGGDGGFIDTSAANVQIKNDVRVSTQASQGRTGTWLIDPNDYTIAASGGNITGAALSTNLASSNVEISTALAGTAGGNGDIFVNDNVTWTSGNRLTLTAERHIKINATLDASGGSGGAVTLNYGQGAVASGNSATYDFGLTSSGFAGKINLKAGQNFTTKLGSDGTAVNWTVITQLGSAGDQTSGASNSLQGLGHASNLNGNFVLGADIDASATSTWNSSAGFKPIGGPRIGSTPWMQSGYAFGGNFDGLGHSISGLVVNKPTAFNFPTYIQDSNNGLFGLAFGGTFSNLQIVGSSITGLNSGGLLMGYGEGVTVSNILASGTVTGRNQLGGLIGQTDRYNNSGPEKYTNIAHVITDAVVSGRDTLGGVVGYFTNSNVTNARSSGSITSTGGTSGGLIGNADANVTITSSSSSVSITSSADFIGGLIGLMERNASVSNSFASGAVNGGNGVGGLVGSTFSFSSAGSQISGSHATGSVSGADQVGGLVGLGQHLSVSNSYATGAVSGTSSVGGLVGGSPDGDLQVSGSHASSAVNASGGSVGGLVGYVGRGVSGNRTVTDSYATGQVTGGQSNNAIGGLVGDGYVSILRSSATGNVSGGGKVGGLIGAAYLDSAETIQQSFATGNVTAANNRAGGLAGISEVALSDVYATGSVTGASEVGGLIGKNDGGSLAQGYSTGLVTGTGTVGGLIGAGTGSVVRSYWDVATSGLGTSGQTGSSAGGTGKTTAELKNILTTSSWNIVEDSSLSSVYPQLRWARSGLSAGNSIWVVSPTAVNVTYNLGPATRPFSGVEYRLGDLFNAASIFGSAYANWLLGTDYSFQYNGSVVTGFTNAGSYSGITVNVLRSGYAVTQSGNTSGALTIAPVGLTPDLLRPDGTTRAPLLPASYVVNTAARLNTGPAQSAPGNVVAVPPAVSLPFAQGEALTVLSTPQADEPTTPVNLSQARVMTGAQGPGASDGTREVRVPVSRNSMAEIVNGGVRLPGGVEQQLFVVRK